MTTLAINNQVVETVKNKFLSELDKMVKEKENAVSTAKVALREAEATLKEVTDARDTIAKGLGHLVTRTGEMRYMASRTSKNGPGHFIEYFKDDKTVTCSCFGFRYNGKCWASDWVKQNEAKNEKTYAGWADHSFNYPFSRSQFEGRIKPIASQYGFNWLPVGMKKW